MAIREVQRGEDGGPGGRELPPQPDRRPREEASPPEAPPSPVRDRAELTAPAAAAMRLLRVRILESVRSALQAPPSWPSHRPQPAAEPDPDDLEGWAALLIQDLNLLAGPVRGRLPEQPLHEVLVAACRQGMVETLEILRDLGADRDPEVWRRLEGTTRALAARLQGAAAGA